MELPTKHVIKIVPEGDWYVIRTVEANEEICRGKNLKEIFNVASKIMAAEVLLPTDPKLIGVVGSVTVDLDLVRDELKALVAVKRAEEAGAINGQG